MKAKDHPRSCGKDNSNVNPARVLMGSPPLVRERRVGNKDAIYSTGITPARAGKTIDKYFPTVYQEDHPRSCGKDVRPALAVRHVVGSPPLVRERHNGSSNIFHHLGITPARAGKTPERTAAAH